MTNQQNRRAFLQKLAALGGAAAVAGRATPLWAAVEGAAPLGIPVGAMTYPVREMIAQDFPGTLRRLKAMGYDAIEMCSPPYYAERGFAGLMKYRGSELKRIINDQGLVCHSSHVSITELRDRLEDRVAWASDLGLTQINVPSLRGAMEPTLDHVKRAADEFTAIGMTTSRAGIMAGVHNEGFEGTSVDGKRTYDLLIELTDPRYVSFQFQLSSVSRGYDPVDYFTRYPGRFISMHVQDVDMATRRSVAVGQGSLDFREIFTAAKTGGVKNYFVEMGLEQLEASAPYLRALQV